MTPRTCGAPRPALAMAAAWLLCATAFGAEATGKPEKEPQESKQSTEMRERLTSVFDVLSAATDVETANRAIAMLAAASPTDGEWRAFFDAYFATKPFTQALFQFWDYAMRQAGVNAGRTAALSADCAGAALKACLAGSPDASTGANDGLNAAAVPLAWLNQIGPSLAPERLAAVRTAIASAAKQPLDVARWLYAGPAYDTGAQHTALQLCLTVAAFLRGDEQNEGAFDRLVKLPDIARTFRASTGILLFDNGMLTPLQVESLDALVQALPSDLHAIEALILAGTIAPEAQAGLVHWGQIVSIPAIAPEILTAPGEFVPESGQPVASAFTIGAAQEIFRAIQAVQFSRRPALVARRNAIVSRAGACPASYLRSTVPVGLYVQNPDELLPQTAYLWFIDSGLTFQTAFDFFSLEYPDAIETVLLLADVLSGGRNSAPLFKTLPNGRVTRIDTPLSRTTLPVPGPMDAAVPIPYANGLKVGGTFWGFQLGAGGMVRSLVRGAQGVDY